MRDNCCIVIIFCFVLSYFLCVKMRLQFGGGFKFQFKLFLRNIFKKSKTKADILSMLPMKVNKFAGSVLQLQHYIIHFSTE